jgi:hypothetical protein
VDLAARGVRFAVICADIRRSRGRLHPQAPHSVLDLTRFASSPALAQPYIGHLTPEANGWVAGIAVSKREALLPGGAGTGAPE